MYKLVAVAGKLRGQEFILEEGDNSVGRETDNSVVLPIHGVSKKHFSITVTGEVAYVKDMGSVNGTFVNDVIVKNATVQNGDKISLPDVILQVVYVKEKKIIIKKKATIEDEKDEASYLRPGEMPKPLPQKLIFLFKYKLMPFLHGMNEEYEWRVIFGIVISLFVLATITLTIFPILSDSRQLLLVETAKRGVHFAQEIGRMNSRALERKNLDRVDTNFLDNEDGVNSYELFDMEGRIVRPIGKMNEYIVDTFSIKALNWVKRSKSEKKEMVQILKAGVIGVAAKITAYNANLGAFEPVGVIAIRFAPRSLAVEATKNTRAYLESLSTSALVAILFFGVIYYLTVRPLEELKFNIDQAVKGKIRVVESKYQMEELDKLRDSINVLLQKNRELSSDGDEGSFEELEDDVIYVDHLREFLRGSGAPGMVLNSQKDMMELNPLAEDLVGIRQSVSEGTPLLECAREKGFAATVIELCDSSGSSNGYLEQGEYELGGFAHAVNVTSLIGKDSTAKAFFVTFVKVE